MLWCKNLIIELNLLQDVFTLTFRGRINNHNKKVCPKDTFSNKLKEKKECIKGFKKEICDFTKDGTILIDEIGIKQCIN